MFNTTQIIIMMKLIRFCRLCHVIVPFAAWILTRIISFPSTQNIDEIFSHALSRSLFFFILFSTRQHSPSRSASRKYLGVVIYTDTDSSPLQHLLFFFLLLLANVAVNSSVLEWRKRKTRQHTHACTHTKKLLCEERQ